MLFFWIAIFIISMAVLIKAADYFTDSSEKVGLFFGLSPFVVGVTIVAIGTSVPELATGIIATLRGATEFVASNVIGSNIANMLLIVGVSSIVGGAVFIRRNLIEVDLPILAMSTALYATFVIWDGVLSLYEGLILLVGFGVYLWYAITHPPKEGREVDLKKIKKEKLRAKTIFVLLGSVVAIYFASKYTVDSIVKIAEILKMNLSSLVAFVVAVGTSLPELVVSLVAVKKKQYEVALGNVFGSNVFNILVIMGIPSLIAPLAVSRDMLLIGLPFLGIATFIYMFSVMDSKVKNYEGAFFLLLYVAFIITLFGVKV